MMTRGAACSLTQASVVLGLVVAGALSFTACGSSQSDNPPATDSDASTDDTDAGPYEGTTTNGGIHSRPEDAGIDPLADAQFSQDNTCCNVVFAIAANGEPAGTTGVVIGSYAPILPPGIALTLSGGTWTAPVCVPVNVPFTYAYQFTEPVVVASGDAGSDAASDAGSDDAASGDAASDDASADAGTIVVQRYDPNLPHQPDGQGGIVNVYDPVPSCAAIDASPGKLP